MMASPRPTVSGATLLDISRFGESYLVNCPFCGDQKQRLSFNDRYGEVDSVTGWKNFHLVKCFPRIAWSIR